MTSEQPPARRGHMHTTTVRFDAETWELLVEHCRVLGVAHADFIRGSVQRRLGALMLPVDRAARLSDRVARLTARADASDRIVIELARLAGLPLRRRDGG